jgi:Iap family predicted aminopeptidase
VFFNSDYRSSLLERNTTSAITEVVGTIIEITDEYSKQGITYNRDKFRSFMKNIDLLAGRSRLAVLNKEQLKEKLTSLYLKAYE